MTENPVVHLDDCLAASLRSCIREVLASNLEQTAATMVDYILISSALAVKYRDSISGD
jgi:hypothetical protein